MYHYLYITQLTAMKYYYLIQIGFCANDITKFDQHKCLDKPGIVLIVVLKPDFTDHDL